MFLVGRRCLNFIIGLFLACSKHGEFIFHVSCTTIKISQISIYHFTNLGVLLPNFLLCTFPLLLAIFLSLRLLRWQEGRLFIAPRALLVTKMEFGALNCVRFLCLIAVLDERKLLLHPPLVMLVLFLWEILIIQQAHNILSRIGELVSTD